MKTEPHLQTTALTTPPQFRGPSPRKRAVQWAEPGLRKTERRAVSRHWRVAHCRSLHRVLQEWGCGNPTAPLGACPESRAGVQRSCEGAELRDGAAGEGGGGLGGG